MQRSHHQPHITKAKDGRWMIRCPQCEDNSFASIPIGIALPLRSLEVTQLVLDNHMNREGARTRKKIA
jgi:hypothetical protein